MKTDCILAVGQVLGRAPTEADIRNIETRLAKAMRLEAVKDPPGWASKSAHQQATDGAKRAAADVLGEAQLKLERQALQVLATARVQQQIANFPGTPMEGLARMVAFHADVKGSQLSVESRAKAVGNDALRRVIDTLEATSPKFFGLIEDPAGIRDLVRELHGEKSGNPDAATGAKAFRDVAEQMRTRFNASGGDIGQLDDWGMPHHHAQLQVAKAGREAWVRDVMPQLNRGKYLNENGRAMTDAEVATFLGEAWTTIATGGVNKLEPGMPSGVGMRANRGNAARQVHFKDADAYLDYQAKYGDRPVYDVLVGHIHGVAKDIALVETFGPNPDATFRQFRDRALRTMTLADPVNAGAAQKQAINVENLYNMAAGKTLPVASARLAQFFDGVRNLMVASKLGSATITAITDEGTMRVAAHVNNLPEMRLIANELAALNPLNKMEERLANRAGLALNTLTASINRFGNETLGSGWSSKLASGTIRASGLAAMTDARRRAWGVTQMSVLGQVSREHATLAALDPVDHRILLSKGITDRDFAVWKLAEHEDWGSGNNTMLTPDAIYRIPDAALEHLGDPRQLREEAATKLLGSVLEETDIAVIEPGIRERSMMQSNLQRGTWKGELTRSIFLFKSFPLTMISKQWTRGMSEPTQGGKVGYLATLTAATTVLGMIALQASQVVTGKDPRDMTEWKTWMQALLKGGALSLFGDFLFDDKTEYGGSVLASLLGPVAGTAEEALALTVGNIHEAARGEDTHIGAEAVKFVKNNTPGANLWYTRAVTDHLLFHRLQQYLSPKYLENVRKRAQREFGQSFWWEPGALAPKRLPDPAAAVGED